MTGRDHVSVVEKLSKKIVGTKSPWTVGHLQEALPLCMLNLLWAFYGNIKRGKNIKVGHHSPQTNIIGWQKMILGNVETPLFCVYQRVYPFTFPAGSIDMY